ncbi:MBL fold metallo-hydrolase [Plantactinospora sp. WMMB782]|uniref:MBL fold metallo-hydrolase n=1 Tax=Plantactinospora sp. WMMB782 TaxID=3404121 RepID=UPI003B95562D
MRIHHLNCGTLRPPSRRLVNGTGGLGEPATQVCHCLLVETGQDLVLVDSGIGLADIRDPSVSPGDRFVRRARPVLDPDETAVRRIAALGFDPHDVRHILVTHLDPDHAGGVADFPWATVHLLAREHQAGLRPTSRAERRRYRTGRLRTHQHWQVYPDPTGTGWFDLPAVRDLVGLPPEIVLVPLPGHTHGHCGVAVQHGTGWVLHAGDAYFDRRELAPGYSRPPLGILLTGALTQADRRLRLDSRRQLRDLHATRSAEVDMFCAHDPVDWQRFVGTTSPAPDR